MSQAQTDARELDHLDIADQASCGGISGRRILVVSNSEEIRRAIELELLAAGAIVMPTSDAGTVRELWSSGTAAIDGAYVDVGPRSGVGVGQIQLLRVIPAPCAAVPFSLNPSPQIVRSVIEAGCLSLLRTLSRDELEASFAAAWTVTTNWRSARRFSAFAARSNELPERPAGPTSSASRSNAFVGDLTRAERNVLELYVRGMTYSKIGASLSISPHTVKRHVSNILRKLGISRREELIEGVLAAAAVPVTKAPSLDGMGRSGHAFAP
jgi:DNA-binding NarL/FixJ family response regulator